MYGNIHGLKASQRAGLERLYRRRIPLEMVITNELAKTCTDLSHQLKRRIAVVISRKGLVEQVMVGSPHDIPLQELTKSRNDTRFLRGLRVIQTHLNNEPLTQLELMNLGMYRLDALAGLGVTSQGQTADIHFAHLLPSNPHQAIHEVWPATAWHSFRLNFSELMHSLEGEMKRAFQPLSTNEAHEQAILVSISKRDKGTQEDELFELSELARSAQADILGQIIQRSPHLHPKYVLGKGKLKEVVIKGLQLGANLIIFNQNLTAAQAQAIAEITEMKVVDRTQLILDIFARRAHSREGKVQVELAQLKYLLPRLSGSNLSLSRLGGGIGSRGPGETKLESDRRRVRDRISHLEKNLASFAKHQRQRRTRRMKNSIPIISIVGYTNAGKSTLLNCLTKSQVTAKDRPFETLDTSSRKLRIPKEQDVIITDTVGFIRDLPQELMGAFRSTLEELKDADILLHVIDATARDLEQQTHSVEIMLRDLDLEKVPRLMVLNKCDRLPAKMLTTLSQRYHALPISALDPKTIAPLVHKLHLAVNSLPSHQQAGEETSEKIHPLFLTSA